MNKLEEQLDFLNYRAEKYMVSPRRGAVCGNAERGYTVCMCSSEHFINHSSNECLTRAAFVSTWLIGFNAAKINKQFFRKYNFLTLDSHGIADNCCPSWIISPAFSKKTFFNYVLMWDCFEEALAVYKEECSNHKEMYRGMEKSIKRMEDEEARGSLTAALDSVYEDDLENLKTSYPIFIR